jgi:hypothetical protein
MFLVLKKSVTLLRFIFEDYGVILWISQKGGC